jgi:hypothetical protein
MMAVMGHGLCVCFGVCGETTKNKEESKIVNVPFPRAMLKVLVRVFFALIFGNIFFSPVM